MAFKSELPKPLNGEGYNEKYARHGKPLICSVHPPSQHLFPALIEIGYWVGWTATIMTFLIILPGSKF